MISIRHSPCIDRSINQSIDWRLRFSSDADIVRLTNARIIIIIIIINQSIINHHVVCCVDSVDMPRRVLKVYRDGKYSSPKCVIVNGRRERQPDLTPGPSDYAPCRTDVMSRHKRQPAYVMSRADSAKRRQAQPVNPGECVSE